LSQAKDEDTRKRQISLGFYNEAGKCLDTMDEKILSLLQQNVGNFKEKMNNHKLLLGNKEYFLLVAGKWH